MSFMLGIDRSTAQTSLMLHELTGKRFGFQYTLLTEILKKEGIPSIYLVNIIKSFRISPRWADIPLPPGIYIYRQPPFALYSARNDSFRKLDWSSSTC